MATVPRLQLVVQSPYKGGTKDWSCTFHFTGSDPTSGEWASLADNVIASFKTIVNDTSEIVRARGYPAGSDIAAYDSPRSVTGTLAAAGGAVRSPLQTASLLEWTTDARTVKNHPIYLFNYIHGPPIESGTDREQVYSAYYGAAADFMTAWVTGFSDGSTTRHRCGPRGAVATGHVNKPDVTHRDFPT